MTSTLVGSCSQPLCSSEGNGGDAGELRHGSAAALAAEEEVHGSDPTAPRERGKGLAQRKGSALEGMIGSFLNSPSHNISSFSFLSFSDHIPAAWRFSSGEMFPCPMPLPCQGSEPPSQPLCTRLCSKKPACLQGSGWAHVHACRWKRAG